jgi:multiple sugar transport system substrate-binding protein
MIKAMPPKLSRMQIIMASIVLAIILVFVLIFTGIIPGLRQDNPNQGDKLKGNLTVWGTFDDELAINSTLIGEFKTKHPNVEISYRSIDPRTYEGDLVDALAAGRGPDVFMVQNTWIPKHYNKLDHRDPKLFTVVNFGDLYPQVVVKDLAKDGAVYAMPLYIDTMAMLYNKSLFDSAGIAQAPRTWDDLVAVIPQLRRVDSSGRISQAAAAIGGSNKNINAANDLLFQLMLQAGVPMTNDAGTATAFNYEAQKALDYYLSFSNQRNPNYTWDTAQHYSIDAFAEESVAIIFNYGYQLQQLKEKNPFLQIGVAPMLQRAGTTKPITYANYFALGVSATSKSKSLAWTFVDEATTDPVTNGKYLNATHRSPALRSLIATSINDPEQGIFAKQALMSTTWKQGDSTGVANAFSAMLDSIITGQLSSSRAFQQADLQVSELLRKINNQ